jgi:hypothetical protein
MNGFHPSFSKSEQGRYMRAFLMVLDDGIVADMVVLERDILAAPMEEIKDIGVVTTIVDGKIVYQK